MKRLNQRGATATEVVIVLVIFVVIPFLAVSMVKCNAVYTDDGVLEKIQVDHPGVEKVITTSRNVWGYSVITIEEAGQRVDYCLDTNPLFNYRVFKCDEDENKEVTDE